MGPTAHRHTADDSVAAARSLLPSARSIVQMPNSRGHRGLVAEAHRAPSVGRRSRVSRHIIVVGQQKTGTTGVYSLIKSALAPLEREYFFSFEPTAQEPLDHVRENAPALSILTKIMYKNAASFTMSTFDKRVMTVRDPRDTMISTLLFKPMIRRVVEQVPMAQHDRFIAALEEKEHDPRQVSVLELMELAVDVGYRRHRPRQIAREQIQMADFAAASDFYVLRYEDFVDGRVSDLATYLGLPLDPQAAKTPSWLTHISRSRGHGAWRHWFTDADVEHYRPLLRRCMSRMGYPDEWELADTPHVPAETSSVYVRDAVLKRRRELTGDGSPEPQARRSVSTLYSMASDGDARAARELARRLEHGTDFGAPWPAAAKYWAERADLQRVPERRTRRAGGRATDRPGHRARPATSAGSPRSTASLTHGLAPDGPVRERTQSAGSEMDSVQILERALATGLYPKSVEALLQKMPSDFHDESPDRYFGEVRKKVAFIFTSRSGTTFFVDALNRSKRMGRVREHFNPYMVKGGQKKWGTSTMSDYVARAVKENTTANGVFGFKGTVEALLPLVQVNEMPRAVHEWHWVSIRRRDTIAQAVSLYRAKATGVWHDHGQHDAPPPTPEYDFNSTLR